jgi:hypothetical protein
VICDRGAASLLTPRSAFASDRILIVLGHREPGISAEHRVSAQSRARLRRARRYAEKTPVRAAVLTGFTSTGGLSEAEQMKTAWDEHAAPALLEVAGRNTAENASRSLPIVATSWSSPRGGTYARPGSSAPTGAWACVCRTGRRSPGRGGCGSSAGSSGKRRGHARSVAPRWRRRTRHRSPR